MTKLRVGWHREHFLSPLLQFAEQDKGQTFELVECPGGTGEMQVKLREREIDVCIGASASTLPTGFSRSAEAPSSFDRRAGCGHSERTNVVQARRAVH